MSGSCDLYIFIMKYAPNERRQSTARSCYLVRVNHNHSFNSFTLVKPRTSSPDSVESRPRRLNPRRHCEVALSHLTLNNMDLHHERYAKCDCSTLAVFTLQSSERPSLLDTERSLAVSQNLARFHADALYTRDLYTAHCALDGFHGSQYLLVHASSSYDL